MNTPWNTSEGINDSIDTNRYSSIANYMETPLINILLISQSPVWVPMHRYNICQILLHTTK